MSKAARQELAKRYANGTLNPTQLTRFAKQWANVHWQAESAPGDRRLPGGTTYVAEGMQWPRPLPDSEFVRLFEASAACREMAPLFVLRSRFMDRGFPRHCKMPPFGVQVLVRRLRIDGEALRFNPAVRGVITRPALPAFPPYPPPPLGSLTPFDGFFGSMVIMPRCDPGHHQVRLDTSVVVTDLATNKLVTSWPLTHELEIDVGEPSSATTARSRD